MCYFEMRFIIHVISDKCPIFLVSHATTEKELFAEPNPSEYSIRHKCLGKSLVKYGLESN